MIKPSRIQGWIEFSRDGLVVDVCNKFFAAVGYARSEVIGQHHRLFCAPECAVSRRDFGNTLRFGKLFGNSLDFWFIF